MLSIEDKMPDLKEKFESLLAEFKKNPNVIGVFLTGSRGKGFENLKSDYDFYVIIKDKVAKKFKQKYSRFAFKGIDLLVYGFNEFKKYAAFGGSYDWDRYSFLHVKPLFDKKGQLQKIIEQKSSIPTTKQKIYIKGQLDAYFNAVYRSLKYHRKDRVGHRFEAAESVRFLLGALFALGGRPQPYYGYLQRELLHYPLKNLPWKPEKFIEIIFEILNTGNVSLQKEVLRKVEPVFRKKGFGKVFDGWKDLDLWKIVKA